MNDSGQYMVQVGDYDQNTYIIQDANGVQYDGGTIISGDLAEGGNLIGESRWVQQTSGRGGKILNNSSFVNGDLVSVNGTGLNLNTRFTPSSIVLNSASGAQFDPDSLRIASAVTGTGGRGRPRGRKPSRGNFPVVPIDMVRQLGIEQQVILQPTVPVATKNKAIQTSAIQMSKKTQCNDIGMNELGVNTTVNESGSKYIHVPVFVPIPVPVYIPVPTFIREKAKPVEMENTQQPAIKDDEDILIVESVPEVEQENTLVVTTPAQVEQENMAMVIESAPVSQENQVGLVSEDDQTVIVTAPVESKTNDVKDITPEHVQTHKRQLSSECDSTPAKQRKIDTAKADKKESDGCKLKSSYGINAWRHWSKNIDLLKLSANDINKYMVEFVQKIRKPTNEPYVPDSIFYLCLGIQLFLLDHNINLNIFVDTRLSGFQGELNKILATFKPKLGENHVLVCRIEEDHLWESQQLGSHSPGVLIYSLCYLLTKQLKIKTAEHHALLSIDQLEVTETEITFRSNSDNQRYIICQPSANSKRCFYNIVQAYIAKYNEVADTRSRCLYLKPASNNDDGWFDFYTPDAYFLDMMLNRIRIVKEVQESLLSSN